LGRQPRQILKKHNTNLKINFKITPLVNAIVSISPLTISIKKYEISNFP